MMQYAVYADLSRPLAEAERSAVFEALDATVPGSGSVGLQKQRPNDEVYFSLVAPSETAARTQAAAHMNVILQKAACDVQYEIEVQGMPWLSAADEPKA